MKIREKLIELRKVPCPVRFEFLDKGFIIEIQYFVAERNIGEPSPEDRFFVFAVTTDGWDLLIDVNFHSEAVLQMEGNEIDSIDVTLSDLLAAKHILL